MFAKRMAGRKGMASRPHHARICYQLRLHNTSLKTIARQLGVSPQAASGALRSPSYDVEKAIAAAIGLTAAGLFPERFTSAGERAVPVRGRAQGRRAPE
jgi:lambda repressor-like predicted transcriptional regulator